MEQVCGVLETRWNRWVGYWRWGGTGVWGAGERLEQVGWVLETGGAGGWGTGDGVEQVGGLLATGGAGEWGTEDGVEQVGGVLEMGCNRWVGIYVVRMHMGGFG